MLEVDCLVLVPLLKLAFDCLDLPEFTVDVPRDLELFEVLVELTLELLFTVLEALDLFR